MPPDPLLSDGLTNPAFWSYAIATLGFAAFAIQLSVGWRGGGRAMLFLASITLGAFWAAAATVFSINPSFALWNTTHWFDIARLVTAACFLAVVLGASDPQDAGRRLGGRLWIFGLIGTIGALALLIGLPSAELQGGKATWAFSPHLTLSLLTVILAEQVYRRSPASRRWAVRPLVVGLAGPMVLDVVLYSDAMLFRGLDPDLWASRGFAYFLALPLLGVAARRNRDWSFEVAVSRNVIQGSTVVLVAGIYLLVISGAGYYVRYFGGTWGKTLQVIVLFGALLALGFLVVSTTFRSKLRVLVAKNFFSYKYDYRDEWLKFTRVLSSGEGPSPVEELCIRALADLVESNGGGLWLKDTEERSFFQVARWNHPRIADVEAVDGALATFLHRSGWVIEVRAARRDPIALGGLVLPDWMDRAPNAWLILPLAVGEHLIGFVVLDAPRVKLVVDWEVRDLLKTAGSQAASYLAMSQATEALIEARKFDAFNRMSAFVVHDLKNLIAQMQLLLRNAKRHHANPDFQRDMLETVEHVADRMTHLMKQLRLGERPVERPGPVDLSALVRRIGQSKRQLHAGLSFDVHDDVMAQGHADRLERVIGHLIENGLDAAGNGGKVSVRVFRDNSSAIIEVKDNGPGMSPEFIRDRLFRPFQTTKANGMGIGAYESHQYVAALGGQIIVKSELDSGTQFRVVLPTGPVEISAREVA